MGHWHWSFPTTTRSHPQWQLMTNDWHRSSCSLDSAKLLCKSTRTCCVCVAECGSKCIGLGVFSNRASLSLSAQDVHAAEAEVDSDHIDNVEIIEDPLPRPPAADIDSRCFARLCGLSLRPRPRSHLTHTHKCNARKLQESAMPCRNLPRWPRGITAPRTQPLS